uniref:DDE Tnp4 domain-containing protein n=1 Tax=Cannabis sativa TaxID=3483 RepID=A0A803QX69_CANSA
MHKKRSYNDTQLRNKYNLLRQRHKDFKSLLKETGIGFSVVTGQVTAPDEVWDRLIRVNKSAKKFRKKGCVLYGKLCVIFGDTTATGSNAHPSTRSPSINLDNDDDDAMSKSPSIRNQESSFDEDGSKRELFNYRHSSLRNVIERCFGVLKARFPILKQMPSYDLKIQKYIVIACCGIHNFIRTNAEKDVYFDGDEDIPEVQDATIQSTHETLNDSVEFSISRDQLREMANVRDEIADHIWRANRR